MKCIQSPYLYKLATLLYDSFIFFEGSNVGLDRLLFLVNKFVDLFLPSLCTSLLLGAVVFVVAKLLIGGRSYLMFIVESAYYWSLRSVWQWCYTALSPSVVKIICKRLVQILYSLCLFLQGADVLLSLFSYFLSKYNLY